MIQKIFDIKEKKKQKKEKKQMIGRYFRRSELI